MFNNNHRLQKNKMNNQIMKLNRDNTFPKLCAVEDSIQIVKLAMECGTKDPADSLWLFQTDEGTVAYLTGDMMTKYYRYVLQLGFLPISADKLTLFSCHSFRVKAAVLLYEAGSTGWFLHQVDNTVAQWLLPTLFKKYKENLSAVQCSTKRCQWHRPGNSSIFGN